MNIPNTLSLFRICAVPVLIWLILNGQMEWAFWLFFIASLTDALDGFIAKRFSMHTQLGAYLDPLADKLLLVSGFIILSVIGIMPLWITLLVVTRDILIIGGALVYQSMTGSLQMRPLWISKLNTTMQLSLLMVVLLSTTYDLLSSLMTPMTFVTAATTLISGWSYVSEWTQQAIIKEQDVP